jgi:hypothetical protein
VAHLGHQDEPATADRLGDLAARRGPDDRVLATVDGQHRLADSSDAALWHPAALIARGCVDEPTRQLATDAFTNLTAFAIRWLTEATEAQQTTARTDPALAARHLVSVVEGLRWPLLFGVYTGQPGLDVLDAQLDQIFGPAGMPSGRQ